MDLSLPIAVQRIGLMMPKDLAGLVINGVIDKLIDLVDKVTSHHGILPEMGWFQTNAAINTLR